MNQETIVAHQLSKAFTASVHSASRILSPFGRGTRAPAQWVLRDVTFAVRRAETLGVLGRNGAGKSTLLRILAGAMQPTSGRCTVEGRAASVLELGLGFNVEMSGRENAITNSLLLGLPSGSIERQLSDISDFSELGEAFDKPLHCYSSGMVARLAFAIAIQADASVLLLDEALAVGDLVFQHKCSAKLASLRKNATMVLASHNTEMLVALCDRVLWLDHGFVREIGDPREVVEHYRAASYAELALKPLGANCTATTDSVAASPVETITRPIPIPRLAVAKESFGNGHASIIGAELYSADGKNIHCLSGGETVQLALEIEVHQGAEHPIVGFVVKGDNGLQVFGMNNETAGVRLSPTHDCRTVRYIMTFRWPALTRGAYSISPAIGEGTIAAHHICHWVHDAIIVTCEPTRTRCVGWLLGLSEATVSEDIVHGQR